MVACVRCRRTAFTLVEVLAALVLVALVLPVAMHGISLAGGAASHAARRLRAASLAEAKLAEVLASGAWESGTQEGDFDDDASDYSWVLDVRDWQTEELQEVELRVKWTARGVERLVSLTTLVRVEGQ